MRYIKDGPFKYRGQPGESLETVGKMLAGFAGGYLPLPNASPPLVLTNKEIRTLNDAEDALGKDPVDGFLVLEDAQVEIILKAIPKMVEHTNRATSAPAILDIIEGADTELPDTDKVVDIAEAQ